MIFKTVSYILKIYHIEDMEIIVINKPECLLTIPEEFQPNLPNLRNLLFSEFGSLWVDHL